ncbi:MAG: O-antigen ligase family protein [Vicinamibacterales bacterium]
MVIFGWLLMAVIAWGALAFGAVYPWAYGPLALVSAGLGVWASVVTRAWRDQTFRVVAMALAAVAAAIALQLVALPYSVVRALSPGVDRFLRQYTLAYHPASLHPMSISPASTFVALTLFVAFALLLLGATRAMKHLRMEWFLSQVLGLGAALSLVGIVQHTFIDKDAPLVYGFWKPMYGASPFGPFVNKNHFAGWMVMVLPVVAAYACALFFRAPPPDRRGRGAWLRWLASVEANRFLLVGVVAVVMSLAVVLTGSRSGIACVALGLLCVGSAVWRTLESGRSRGLAAGALGLIVIGGLAWGGADLLVSRFGKAPVELEGRFAAWRDTSRIIADFPLFGTGLGTYARSMLVYQASGRTSMYAQAHNDYLQLLSEGGLVVIIPVIVAAVVIVGVIRRRLRSGQDAPLTAWARIGAVAGLVAILAQSTVEFSLQMPGNMVLFVVLIALAAHRPSQSRPHASRI